MTLRCADQYSNQWATPATPVNTFVLIHLPKTRWAALLTFVHHPGSGKETPIQPAFQMSLHFKNCQQVFVPGFCFYCRRGFIKILFAGPCHLNKIWHRNALTIIVPCISKLYYILCVPTKWRYRENPNQVGEPLVLLLNTHMSPLSKLGVTRCLPSDEKESYLSVKSRMVSFSQKAWFQPGVSKMMTPWCQLSWLPRIYFFPSINISSLV